MWIKYIAIFIVSSAISVIFTLIIKKAAFYLKIVDIPKIFRKIHKKPTPL